MCILINEFYAYLSHHCSLNCKGSVNSELKLSRGLMGFSVISRTYKTAIKYYFWFIGNIVSLRSHSFNTFYVSVSWRSLSERNGA